MAILSKMMETRVKRLAVVAAAVAVLLPGLGEAQRPKPQEVAMIGGEKVYKVLPVGEIPAIDEPEFVSGAKANRQMSPDEPVLGVVIGSEARAYSLWQLDAHEIVNDQIAGSAIAATW
jgi:hypothetical protein